MGYKISMRYKLVFVGDECQNFVMNQRNQFWALLISCSLLPLPGFARTQCDGISDQRQRSQCEQQQALLKAQEQQRMTTNTNTKLPPNTVAKPPQTTAPPSFTNTTNSTTKPPAGFGNTTNTGATTGKSQPGFTNTPAANTDSHTKSPVSNTGGKPPQNTTVKPQQTTAPPSFTNTTSSTTKPPASSANTANAGTATPDGKSQQRYPSLQQQAAPSTSSPAQPNFGTANSTPPTLDNSSKNLSRPATNTVPTQAASPVRSSATPATQGSSTTANRSPYPPPTTPGAKPPAGFGNTTSPISNTGGKTQQTTPQSGLANTTNTGAAKPQPGSGNTPAAIMGTNTKSPANVDKASCQSERCRQAQREAIQAQGNYSKSIENLDREYGRAERATKSVRDGAIQGAATGGAAGAAVGAAKGATKELGTRYQEYPTNTGGKSPQNTTAKPQQTTAPPGVGNNSAAKPPASTTSTNSKPPPDTVAKPSAGAVNTTNTGTTKRIEQYKQEADQAQQEYQRRLQNENRWEQANRVAQPVGRAADVIVNEKGVTGNPILDSVAKPLYNNIRKCVGDPVCEQKSRENVDELHGRNEQADLERKQRLEKYFHDQ